MLRFIWHHAASCLSRFMVLCTPSRLKGCPCRLVSPQHHARNKGNYKGRRTTRLPVCIPSWAWATLAVACRGAFGRHTLLHGVQICEKSKKAIKRILSLTKRWKVYPKYNEVGYSSLELCTDPNSRQERGVSWRCTRKSSGASWPFESGEHFLRLPRMKAVVPRAATVPKLDNSFCAPCVASPCQ